MVVYDVIPRTVISRGKSVIRILNIFGKFPFFTFFAKICKFYANELNLDKEMILIDKLTSAERGGGWEGGGWGGVEGVGGGQHRDPP